MMELLPSTSIAAIVRAELLHQDGVIKFAPNRRFTTLYSEGSPADSILFQACHGSKHGWMTLAQICDFARVLDSARGEFIVDAERREVHEVQGAGVLRCWSA